MTYAELVTRAGAILADDAHVRWSVAALLLFLADGCRQVALSRPDACGAAAPLALVPGAAQTLPAGALRLIDITRNLGPDGQTPGSAVTCVDGMLLDLLRPERHAVPSAPGGGEAPYEVRHFAFDERRPRAFSVWPPVPASTPTWVEAVWAVAPPAAPAADDALAVDEAFAVPVLDYALSRAFAVDTESRESRARGDAHLAAFAQALSAKLPADLLVSPNHGRAGA